MRGILGMFLFGLAVSFAGAGLAQDRQRTVWDGVYSSAQADRGSALYMQRCAVCHGVTLGGNNEAPPLVGEFIPDWDGTTLAQLSDKIGRTMPLDHPGSLSAGQTADILAFLLKANNFPSGSKDIDTSEGALSGTLFTAHNPGADKTRPTNAARNRSKVRGRSPE